MRHTFRLFAALFALATPAAAHDGVHVIDPYARVSSAMATTGAVFFVIENHGSGDDRLVSASTDAAKRAELHTHLTDANGIMQMREVPDGFAIPAGGAHALKRGGDHVMLLGLAKPLAEGEVLTLTLRFERSGEVVVEVPVDSDRTTSDAADHGSHGSAPSP